MWPIQDVKVAETVPETLQKRRAIAFLQAFHCSAAQVLEILHGTQAGLATILGHVLNRLYPFCFILLETWLIHARIPAMVFNALAICLHAFRIRAPRTTTTLGMASSTYLSVAVAVVAVRCAILAFRYLLLLLLGVGNDGYETEGAAQAKYQQGRAPQ